ncbi:hypothetical protein [Corticimicrobacter populi]|uniref:hypothetical protein n=1 Tax=Corticimicrobacter populi TaxID=2175229 RepID=UPI0011B24A81|nr:hypothetical protein [Corticimicrobacter populi]
MKYIFLFSLCMIVGSNSFAEEVGEEPDGALNCSVPNPDGIAFVSLGTTVFRIPRENVNSHSNWPSRALVLPDAPDPSQPAGCYKNPRASQMLFGFNKKIDDFEIEQYSLINSAVDYFGSTYEDLYKKFCQDFSGRRYLKNGLIGCFSDRNAEASSGLDEIGLYRVDPSIYSTPFGQDFIVNCIPSASRRGIYCSVSYKLYSTVNILYRFFTHKISLENIIEYDGMLRNNFSEIVVSNYEWGSGDGI